MPGLRSVGVPSRTGGTNSALYCYGVWLKHLTMLCDVAPGFVPRSLAELGPGDSLGIGLAAVLSGVDRYYALDVMTYNDVDYNLRIFEELVALLSARSPRPRKGWPEYDALLDESLFPHHVLTEDRLQASLAPDRLSCIREAIRSPNGISRAGGIEIRYIAPWYDVPVLAATIVDLILSHSVLEHVDDLDATYAAMKRYLRPGGHMSHQVDFSAHGMSRRWNGYRTCPEWLWKVARGRRPFLINREPASGHLRRAADQGFDVIRDLRQMRTGEGVLRDELAARWQQLSDEDLDCASLFFQARRQ